MGQGGGRSPDQTGFVGRSFSSDTAANAMHVGAEAPTYQSKTPKFTARANPDLFPARQLDVHAALVAAEGDFAFLHRGLQLHAAFGQLRQLL